MKKLLATLVLFFGAAALAQQSVSVTWMTGNVARDVEFARSVAQRYMDANPHTIGGQEYNVTINVLPGPESATDRLGLYLQYFQARSTEVDIFEIDVIWPGDLAEHLVNLYEYEGFEETAPTFFASIIENNTVDGALVGIPYFTDAGILYYRTDLLEKYGYDGPPETWTELEEMARTIQEGERGEGNPDFWGFVWQGNAYEGLTCDALEWIYAYNGGQIIEPDGTITVNNPNAVAAIEKAAGWVGTISPPGVTGFQEEDARAVWQAGNAAFMRNWPYAYSLGQAEDSVIRDRFGVAPLPAGDVEGGRPAATLGGWQLGVGAYSPNPAVAADVALFITNYDNQLERALALSQFPTIEAVYEDPALLESDVAWLAELLPVFQNSVARPSTVTAPRYGEVSRLFFSAVHDVLTGQEDAETALAILELDLQDLLGFPTGQP
jgi:trehalose/maltose transport system substrate-binding protein